MLFKCVMRYFVESQIHSSEYSTWRSVVHLRVSFCVMANFINGAFTIEGNKIHDSEQVLSFDV